MTAIVNPVTRFSDEPVFTSAEQEILASHPHAHPYAPITKPQFVGLLHALGEYSMRVGYRDSMIGNNPELEKQYWALVAFGRKRHMAASCGPVLNDELVFAEHERAVLRWQKYIGSCEHVTRQWTFCLLDTLGGYTHAASPVPQVFDPFFSGYLRVTHAHNALLSFREKPFTWREYVSSLHSVRMGRESFLVPLERTENIGVESPIPDEQQPRRDPLP